MSFRVSSAAAPTHFELSQNTPNPFNPTTRIEYQLPRSVHVRLMIYNVQGQEVRRLVDVEQQVGVYRVEWNGLNDAGKPVASGIYLYRLQADEFTQTRKMMLVR
ncbi:MAG: T9SS type A sorting domain-containing protein [Candidatus Latescibacteria bacterium]|nr:T9SS type A sorting domain-containing protein [Candidatus Latescibacterota bacterium]